MTNRPGIMAQGDLAEQSRQQQLNSNNVGAIDLNKYSGASNFALVDLSTQQGFESVKAFTDAQQAVDHLMLLQVSEKWAPSKILGLREAAAKSIVNNAKDIQAEKAWPENVPKNAGVEDVKRELSENTKVTTADDTANEARELLKKSVPVNPELWNVNMKAADLGKAIAERIAHLAARIVGCGKNAAELTAHGENSVKAGPSHQASNLDRLAAPQPEPASSASTSTAAEPATSAHSAPAPPATGSPNPGSLPSNTPGLY